MPSSPDATNMKLKFLSHASDTILFEIPASFQPFQPFSRPLDISGHFLPEGTIIMKHGRARILITFYFHFVCGLLAH